VNIFDKLFLLLCFLKMLIVLMLYAFGMING